jgi:hypothetical protein
LSPCSTQVNSKAFSFVFESTVLSARKVLLSIKRDLKEKALEYFTLGKACSHRSLLIFGPTPWGYKPQIRGGPGDQAFLCI